MKFNKWLLGLAAIGVAIAVSAVPLGGHKDVGKQATCQYNEQFADTIEIGTTDIMTIGAPLTAKIGEFLCLNTIICAPMSLAQIAEIVRIAPCVAITGSMDSEKVLAVPIYSSQSGSRFIARSAYRTVDYPLLC